jgi:hypothetical protein
MGAFATLLGVVAGGLMLAVRAGRVQEAQEQKQGRRAA